MEDFIPVGMLGWAPPAEIFDGSDGVAPMRWTVPMMYTAVKAGIIYEGSRFELFRGQIIQTAERPMSHFYLVGIATGTLTDILG